PLCPYTTLFRSPGGDQATEKLILRHSFLCGQRGEFAMAGGRELLSGTILLARCPTQDLAVETEPVGVLSRDLALGAVPGRVEVAVLGHLAEEAERRH